MIGNISMGNNQINDLGLTSTRNNSAVTKNWVEDKISAGRGLSSTGFTMKGHIDKDHFKMINLPSTPKSDPGRC